MTTAVNHPSKPKAPCKTEHGGRAAFMNLWGTNVTVRQAAPILAAFIVLAGLYAASFYNYLLFHSLAETFSIVIAFGIFMVAWNTRRYSADPFLMLIGIAFLFVGMLDLAHTLAYAGMNVFVGHGANTATQLWIAARYMESLTLLAAPLMLDRKVRPGLYFVVYGALSATVLLTIFVWPVFPDCYLSDAGGLTPFKKISEYIICLVLLAAGALVVHRRERFDAEFASLLLLSIAATVLAELAFTTYASVFAVSNLIGHYLKIVAYYLMYKAVIETGLAKPFDALFKDLSRELEVAKKLQQVSLQLIQADNTQLLHDRILDTAVAIMRADFASIQIMHPKRGALQLLGHRGFNERAAQFWDWIHPASGSVCAMALRARERVVLPDVLDCDALAGGQDLQIYLQNGIRAVQSTPLVSRSGRLLGMLSTHWRNPYEPKRHELRALDLLARQAADLIDRKQAEEVLRTNQERLALLATVAERLLRSDDPQAVVEDLCRLAMAHLDCQLFFNYLVDESGHRLRLNAHHGVSAATAAEIRHLDFGVAVCGCVARDSRRIIAERIQQNDDPHTALVKSYGVQAYCCHPLMVQDDLIGTLSFGTRNRPSFTAEEVALMKSIADQVSVALQRLRTETLLHQLNATLLQQVAERTALAEARAKQLQALAVDLIEAEERERRQFALLLHDDLQQMLAAAKMQVQTVHETAPDPILSKVEEILAESIAKSRRLSHQLSPAVLHHTGLTGALQWLARQMKEQFGLTVELAADGEQRLENAALRSFLFRAVQELLFNAVKHAGVKSACVTLARSARQLTITVSDQGRGFDPATIDAAGNAPGFGLLSLRERAGHIGGRLAIDSAPGQGSRFTLSVPLDLAAGDRAGEARPEINPPPRGSQVPEAKQGGVRVLLVDDHPFMRQGLIQLVAHQPDIRVVGEASNGREALEKTRDLRPDVVVMDVSMPEMDGIEATRRITAAMPEVRVIGLSMHEDEDLTRAMCAAGAETLVSKAVSSAELIQAIYRVPALQDRRLLN